MGRKSRATTVSGGVIQSVVQYDYDADNRPTCTAVRMTPSVFSAPPASACAQSKTLTGSYGAYGPDRISQNVYGDGVRLTSVLQGVGTASGDGTRGPFSAKNIDYYPGKNLVQSVSDANGNTTSYAYDGLNRQIIREWPITRSAASSTATLSRQVVYDNLGRIVSATSNGQTLTYTYNALGEITSETQPLGKVSYTYDAAGRRTSMTWPDGFAVTYSYDLTNQLQTITAVPTSGAATTVASFTYDNLGRRLSLVRGGGAATSTYAYNGVFLSSLALTFAGTPANNQTYGFTYNPAGQITGETFSNQAYDLVPPAFSGSVPYTANALNQIAISGSNPLSYDGHGSFTSNGTVTFSYDPLNNLLSSSAGGTLTYDPIGRLASAGGASGTASRFLYDGNHAIAEYNGSTPTQHYIFGPGADEPLVWYTGGSTIAPQYLLADQRGSIVATTNATGSLLGAVNTYDSYGAGGMGNTGRFQYTGQMWLPEISLYHYKARSYSPSFARFLQADPAGYSAGMNLYAYVGGDPINATDPTGMSSFWSNWHSVFLSGDRDMDDGEKATTVYQDDPKPDSGNNRSGYSNTFFGGTDSPAVQNCQMPSVCATGAPPGGFGAGFMAGLGAGFSGNFSDDAYLSGNSSQFAGALAGNLAGGIAEIVVEAVGGAATDGWFRGVIGNAPSSTIVFGTNANATSHALRHVKSLGLDSTDVMDTIIQDLQPRLPLPITQNPIPFIGNVTLNGIPLEYVAYPIGNGVVNVGRITGP